MSLCQLCSIDCSASNNSASAEQSATMMRPAGRERRLPTRFQDSVVMETVGSRVALDDKASFRNHVYLPVVDNLLSEFERRFDNVQCSVMRGIQALNPTSEHFADVSHIRPFAEAYNADLVDLEHELHQAKRLIERLDDKGSEKPNSLVSFISCISAYGEAFHELHRLGKIAIALPVSTASCERSFSALRHIKTWVRNAMSNSRLSNVALLVIERERALSLSNEKAVDAFAAAHKNRRIALM